MKNDLKTCPFCGGAPFLESNMRAFVDGESTRAALVHCQVCSARTGKFAIKEHGRQQAINLAKEAWNKRIDEKTSAVNKSCTTCHYYKHKDNAVIVSNVCRTCTGNSSWKEKE